jgi:mRNA interferase RelE/StbE
MYKILLTRQATKHLSTVEKQDVDRIKKALQTMKTEPFSGDVVKLSGYDAYRRRVGKFRILFSLEESTVTILVLDILRRNEKTYKS